MTATRSAIRPGTPSTLDDLRKRAVARVVERIDPAKNRHKPASLLRAEAKRLLDQFLETEAPTWSKADRDRLADEVLAETVGHGPLDELFADPAVTEFVVLTHDQIAVRKKVGWLPSNVWFKDPDQYRRLFDKLVSQGEAVTPGSAEGAVDVWLKNGFRLIAVVPPAGLELLPACTFVRATPPVTQTPAPASRAVTQSPAPGRAVPKEQSGVISFAATLSPSAGGSAGISAAGPLTTRVTDPLMRLKVRVSERMVRKLAAAGMYDLGAIPTSELSVVLSALVGEVAAADKLYLTDADRDRLVLEILSGMQR
jgi:hypothetical protein